MFQIDSSTLLSNFSFSNRDALGNPLKFMSTLYVRNRNFPRLLHQTRNEHFAIYLISHIGSRCRNNDCLCNFQSSFSFGVIQRVQFIVPAMFSLSFVFKKIRLYNFCFCFMCRKLKNINKNNGAAFAFRRHCMMILLSVSLTLVCWNFLSSF